MTTTLVTGGVGYIGSIVVRELLNKDEEVKILDDFSNSSPRNLRGCLDANLSIGDIRDKELVEDCLESVDRVLHLAAITGAGKTHEIREKTFDINYEATKQLLKLSEEKDVEKFVFASSCNNYGRVEEKGLDENSSCNPINPYAEAKLKAEKAVQNSDLNSVSLRMATNYGYSPGIRFNLVINKFVFRALMNEPLTIYGDGSNWRPFINVNDAAKAYLKAFNWEKGVYNVGEDNYQIEEIAKKIKKVTGSEVPVKYLKDKNPGPSYNVKFDKMKNTGFNPEIDLEEGIDHLAQNLKNP